MKGNIKIGIVGSAGYAGGELIRLLVNHPSAEIVFAHSKSNVGKFIYEVHTDLLGDTDLKFSNKLSDKIDVLFLCVGHGEANGFLETHKILDKIRIIDLSQDHRIYDLRSTKYESKNRKLVMSEAEPSSIVLRKWVYGLPELNSKDIKSASNVANPGCFATCIQLGLLPLAANKELKNDIHISATTGSTGAGQSLSATSHFTWRNNNMSSYKAFEHQHLAEIGQSISQLRKGFDQEINFIPYRGSFTRGIIASIYLESKLSLKEANQLFEKYYSTHPFVHISKAAIDLKQIVNTNKCFLYLEKHNNKLMITSIIDNLIKGASGQAVQNMNLMCGIEETTGLKLKASAF